MYQNLRLLMAAHREALPILLLPWASDRTTITARHPTLTGAQRWICDECHHEIHYESCGDCGAQYQDGHPNSCSIYWYNNRCCA